MCDYSLEMYASRKAKVRESLTTTRFASGSIGTTDKANKDCAVCLDVGTKLRLDNVPQTVQVQAGVGATAEATFARIDTGAYHDAVEFEGGCKVSLQHLGPGVQITILQTVGEQEMVSAMAIDAANSGASVSRELEVVAGR